MNEPRYNNSSVPEHNSYMLLILILLCFNLFSVNSAPSVSLILCSVSMLPTMTETSTTATTYVRHSLPHIFTCTKSVPCMNASYDYRRFLLQPSIAPRESCQLPSRLDHSRNRIFVDASFIARMSFLYDTKQKPFVAAACTTVAVVVAGGLLFKTKMGESLLLKASLALHDRLLLPDFITRWGCRKLIGDPDGREQTSVQGLMVEKKKFIEDLKQRGIAEQTKEANEQHYEVDTRFFNLVLGNRQKYSSALYPEGTPRSDAAALLDEAEIRMLKQYAQRLKVTQEDSFKIMDVGCGWGSVTLWFAENFPKCDIVGFSNSTTQRVYIMDQAKQRGLKNVQVVTGDISQESFDKRIVGTFDRLISIEMFEHMKNYKNLMKKLSTLLKPNGYMFVHIFVSRLLPSHYVVESEKDWMTKYFFEGGTLPSDDLLLYFQEDFVLKDKWWVNGIHYSLTLEAWLQRMDMNSKEVKKLFEQYYPGNATTWIARWRTFFISCSEFFSYNGGADYYVSHYLFQKRAIVEADE